MMKIPAKISRMKKYLFLSLICSVTLSFGQNFYVEEFGAQAGINSNNAYAIQKTIDKCYDEGGGVVILSKGTYRSGTIILKSNVSLKITPNSILKSVEDTSAFITMPAPAERNWHRKALIYANSIENTRIFGGGKIDGAGTSSYFNNLKKVTDYVGLLFINCENVVVEDLKMQNSISFMQRYSNCRGVRIRNIDVYNHATVTNDGLDIDSSEDVIISGCFIDSGDDAIVIKSVGNNPAKNIVISNCILATHASAIKLGTESAGGFQNVNISNIVIKKSVSKEMIHPLKVWGGLTGIEVLTTDGGISRHIMISNIIMEEVENPIHVRLGNRLRRTFPFMSDELTEERLNADYVLEDIIISNVLCRNVGPYPVIIAGFEDNPVKRVILRDITMLCSRPGTQSDINTSPNWDAKNYPGRGMYRTNLPAYGLVSYHTEGLIVENFRALAADGEVRPLERHFFRK